jgi:hypothetical protein
MRVTTIIGASVLCGVAGTALACDLPKLPLIPPKDQVAGKEAQITAAVQGYFAAMQLYTTCVKNDLTAAGGDGAPAVVKKAHVDRNNTAVREAEFMMKLFTDNVGAAAPGVGGPPAPADR